MSERVDQLAGELEELLSPLPAPLKRRALGQFLARIEDTLASRTEATRGEKRRALGFGFGALVAGAALYLLKPVAEPFALVGQLVFFAGIFVLLGPLSRWLSDIVSGR